MNVLENMVGPVAAFLLLTTPVAANAQTAETPAAPPPVGAPQPTGPSTRPILRIEATMHTAPISRIGVDREGRYLVTGSGDKTARVWRLSDGTLVHVLRPPIGSGNEGRVDAVAISPNGSLVACGGYTGVAWDRSACIYLFDRARGVLLRRIAGLPEVIDDLSFSPDGQFLAAGLIGGGVRVCQVADGKIVMSDKDYENRCAGTDWDASGRLVTSSYDGNIRLYAAAPDFKLMAKAKAPAGSRPYAARFSPDGSRIAVGYGDSNAVSVLDSRDLSLAFTPIPRGLPPSAALSKVCWSADGKMLFAAGSAADRAGARYIRGWTDGGRGMPGDLAVAKNTISDLRTLPAGGASGGELVFASLEPAWGVVDAADYMLSLGRTATTADYRNNLTGFQLSTNGAIVGFSYVPFGKAPARFNAAIGALAIDSLAGPGATATALAALTPPVTLADGTIAVADWNNTAHPTLNGKPLPLSPVEVSHRLAIAPDRQSFLLGTSFGLRCFGADGRQKWRNDAQGETWGVDITKNGDIAAAAFGDGTIRWYRMRDGKELLAFFPNADRKRWVLWTPEGYYDSSAGGEDLIGWNINRGKDQEADFFPASRFRSTYYRPDLVRRVLAADSGEASAITGRMPKPADPAGFDPASAAAVAPKSVAAELPPVVGIVSPADFAPTSAASVAVRVSLRTPADSPIIRLRVLVDGRPVDVGAPGGPFPEAGAGGAAIESISVQIPARDCEVSVIAANRNASSSPASFRIKWMGAVAPLPKPKLYVLAIGVSRYALPGRDLLFPAKDAADFATALTAQSKSLYSGVEMQVLTDEKVTRESVLAGLNSIQDRVTANDVAVVFLAGHAESEPDGSYGFLTHDFDGKDWQRTAVGYADIQPILRDVKGRVIFLVDTARAAGQASAPETPLQGDAPDMSALVNDFASADNGVVVFAASTGRQRTPEDRALGNGPFTLALLEAIDGKPRAGTSTPIAVALAAQAQLRKAPGATVAALEAYLDPRIIQLTDGAQAPTTTRPATVPDFPIFANP